MDLELYRLEKKDKLYQGRKWICIEKPTLEISKILACQGIKIEK